jgi:hypothetical protein
MLLEWGFGPLEIDASSYKFGEVPISNYTDYTIITLDRKTEPTSTQLQQFNAIYGKDIDQKNLQQEIVCDGNPEVTVTPGPWLSIFHKGCVKSRHKVLMQDSLLVLTLRSELKEAQTV